MASLYGVRAADLLSCDCLVQLLSMAKTKICYLPLLDRALILIWEPKPFNNLTM